MATFTFEAKDQDGKQVAGTRTGASRQEVIARLRAESLVVTSVKEGLSDGEGKSSAWGGFLETLIQGRVRPIDLMTTTRQLAAMLGAGISLTDGVHTIAHGLPEGALRKVLLTVRSDVQRGTTLTEALRRHPKVFDHLYVSLVHAGEASGSLAQSVGRLAEYLERREEFRQKMRSATAYPKFVFGFFVVLTTGIFLFLIPKFESIFSGFKVELPFITRLYITLSKFLKSNVLLIILAMIALYLLYRYFCNTKTGRQTMDRITLKVPFFGSLMLKAAVERLAVTTGTLLGNGIPLTDALHIASATLGNALLEAEIRDVRAEVMKGRSLSESLARMPHVPRLLARMVHVGEESGTLSNMFEEVASYYDQEVDRALGRVAVVVEPILIIGMGLVVLTTLYALYRPIFELGRSVKGGH